MNFFKSYQKNKSVLLSARYFIYTYWSILSLLFIFLTLSIYFSLKNIIETLKVANNSFINVSDQTVPMSFYLAILAIIAISIIMFLWLLSLDSAFSQKSFKKFEKSIILLNLSFVVISLFFQYNSILFISDYSRSVKQIYYRVLISCFLSVLSLFMIVIKKQLLKEWVIRYDEYILHSKNNHYEDLLNGQMNLLKFNQYYLEKERSLSNETLLNDKIKISLIKQELITEYLSDNTKINDEIKTYKILFIPELLYYKKRLS